ncbi:MAG: Rieske 2Fe-2S domain-containing protein [Acidimicrobiia bacterium]|nr:Rieske 2Fe-2S domain-containing protein [Acidimicrobiia bacterium]
MISAIAAVALGVVYARGGQAQAEGLLLAVTSGGIGAGIVVWAKASTPHDEVTEARHPLASSEAEVAAFTEALAAGERALVEGKGRRGVLLSAGAALTAFGAALLFPIRSLGPRPGRDLKETPYGDSLPVRVVTEDGRPVRVDDLPVDSLLTVWPEGHVDAADAPTLLIRTRPDRDLRVEDGAGVVDGVVAYSKLCTHMGCPVGLYQAEEGLLLCPCHQSTFDVYDAANPVFGPAARPLPQLPLATDDDGYLVATADFMEPVGPGFWDRGR